MQHITNMPSTPTLPKTSHFQTTSLENNPQPQTQAPPRTCFTIEISTAPKKRPHLLEHLCKRTRLKDSEMGDYDITRCYFTTTNTTRKTLGANTQSNTILDFQRETV